MGRKATHVIRVARKDGGRVSELGTPGAAVYGQADLQRRLKAAESRPDLTVTTRKLAADER